MKMNKKHTAFSLMELSIVILIISIITAGITQSSKLISSFRLSSSRNLTQNSPVSATEGLVGWFESVSVASFADAETNNGSQVSQWNDINPQSSLKKSLTQPTAGNRPTYTLSAINGIPALKFTSSSSQYLEFPFSGDFNQKNFTIFAVVQPTAAPTGNGAIISSVTEATFKGYAMYLTSGSQYQTWLGSVAASAWQGTTISAAGAANNTALLTAVYDGTNYRFYFDGAQVGANLAVNFDPNILRVLRIGAAGNDTTTATSFFNGYIGEIIIYGRALKNDDRTPIEAYLTKKWGL